jgi:tetratricopeptide (TPR) repeat protein
MTRRLPTAFALFLVAPLLVMRTSTDAQERRLGSVDFPNSGAATAQSSFLEGVLLLHSFEFEDAATAFRRAQEIDPEFAMAYWGEAMTYNHPLWRQQDKPAALAALSRYASTPQERQAKAPTEREAAYLATLDVLYGEGTKTQRDRAYMDAMARLSAAYPEDLEARVFHGLAVLGSTDGDRDFATYMRAAAIAQPVFDANPDHPGAAHYIIHSFDDPVHAPLGLEAARAYSEIAPDAAHAQHMTSHIFVAMGMWDDVVSANVRARDVQNARLEELGRPPNACGHYTSWLHYGWLMKGQMKDAERGMSECLRRVRSGSANDGEIGYFVNMRARHVLDTREWDAARLIAADVDRAGYRFVSGYAALKRGDRAEARHALEQLRPPSPEEANPRRTIMALELDALLALDGGDGARAVALLEDATELEESLPFEFGPPASLKPPHELLGEVYLELGDHEGAFDAFRAALERTPERTPSLEGLVEAARPLDEDAAAAARARLAHIRRDAN